ncbi:hypothetical protein SLU01_00730 [Sporosarcina luteola]|uniref:Uncharacterized protein n=1 Tax=Sporosarcina luteola TaxID=582850 RepID=A0A511Z2U0_9BACL|nr:hypothetical protein [Sporosarcina luteola]GEN81761.1 hypothetical protein SLU01_00730 [Sporosarcina luteola]
MENVERKIIRLELQVGELIRILAHLNERIKNIEEKERDGKIISIHKRQATHRI